MIHPCSEASLSMSMTALDKYGRRIDVIGRNTGRPIASQDTRPRLTGSNVEPGGSREN